MAAVDSEAVFLSRCLLMGLSLADFNALKAKGWNTFAQFGFASSYIPGQTDDSKFVTDVIEAILGQADHPKSSTLRRLYFESYTLTASDLRSKLERTGDDPPKKMPAPERNQRYNALAMKLPGIELKGPHEPSHHLIDLCTSLLDDGVMKYIAWEDLSSREDELQGVQKNEGMETQQLWSP